MLLPLILRMAKRSPDAVLGSAARVLALLRLDLGQHAAPVVADLQPLLRHVKPPTRCAPSAARRRTHAPRAPRASLCSAQVGRGGRGGGAGGAERRPGRAARRARGGPGRPGRRRRAAAARRARAPGPGPGGRRAGGGAGRRARRRGRGGSRRRPPVRAVSVRGARSLLRGRGQAAGAPRSRVRPRREEANEEVRLAIVAALGAWLGRLAAWPPCALARMNDSLAEREPLRRAHLRALVQARARAALRPPRAPPLCRHSAARRPCTRWAQALRGCPEARAQAGGLAAALARVVRDGLAKPAQRADGLLALLAAAYVGAADGAARAELERERAWAAALQPDSALLAPAVLAKLAEEDAPLAAALAEAVLLHVRARAPSMSRPPCGAAASAARRLPGCARSWRSSRACTPRRRRRACCSPACCTPTPACAGRRPLPRRAARPRPTCPPCSSARCWTCCATRRGSRCAAPRPQLPEVQLAGGPWPVAGPPRRPLHTAWRRRAGARGPGRAPGRGRRVPCGRRPALPRRPAGDHTPCCRRPRPAPRGAGRALAAGCAPPRAGARVRIAVGGRAQARRQRGGRPGAVARRGGGRADGRRGRRQRAPCRGGRRPGGAGRRDGGGRRGAVPGGAGRAGRAGRPP